MTFFKHSIYMSFLLNTFLLASVIDLAARLFAAGGGLCYTWLPTSSFRGHSVCDQMAALTANRLRVPVILVPAQVTVRPGSAGVQLAMGHRLNCTRPCCR